MTPMFAQCPACLTVFEIDAIALVAAHGRLRCGECGDVFDALRTLTDRLPGPEVRLATLPLRFLPPEVTQTVQLAVGDGDSAATTPDDKDAEASALSPEPPIDAQSVAQDTESSTGSEPSQEVLHLERSDANADASDPRALDGHGQTIANDDYDSTSPTILDARAPGSDVDTDNLEHDGVDAADHALAFASAFAQRGADGSTRGPDHPSSQSVVDDLRFTADATEPRFARSRTAPRARNGRWLIAASVLALVLVGEIGWAERARWIDDPLARASLDPLCARLHCHLPLREAPDQLQLLSREVRPHPSVPGALMITASIRNDAAFAQAFPVVAITLSDLDEKRIAMRRFRPEEYLHGTDASTRGIGAGAIATLAFEIADPGKNAIAFEFRFDK